MRLERQARRWAEARPQAVAMVDDATRLSYGELAEQAGRLAGALVQVGVRPGDRVAVLSPKSARAITAIQGVLEAGACYVPLDPDSPASRIARIMQSCAPVAVVAGGDAQKALVGGQPNHVVDLPPVIWADDRLPPASIPIAASWADVMGSRAVYERWASDDDVAYVMFTSGSTGTPKGVPITHANVSAFLDWAVPYFGTGADDRLSGHPPLHFDLSVFDIFGAFAAGAELHPVRAEINLLPHKVAAFIRDRRLTQWFSVPSVLTFLAKFDVVQDHDFPTLRRLLWCGEVLPTPILQYWMRRLPHVTFTNLYGPTETTIASSYYTVPSLPSDDTASIPIGRACAGEELLVLDGRLAEAPAGEIGELFIGGAGLSRGYWNDEDETARAFIPDPRPGHAGRRLYRTGDLGRRRLSGDVEFVGRRDSQIKARGYRIELGEIEASLRTMADVAESAVVAISTNGFQGVEICCAYVPVSGAEVTAQIIRATLTERLPSYMIPTRWLQLPALPKNINGKIDGPALKQAFEASPVPR